MTFRDVDRMLKADGWYIDSIEGSHYHYKHPTKKGKVQVPRHQKPKEIKKRYITQHPKASGAKIKAPHC